VTGFGSVFVNGIRYEDNGARLVDDDGTVKVLGTVDNPLKLGMVVRTRADADTVESRTGDRSRREAAFASGAQYISTDYMTPDLRLSDYSVALPGGGTGRRAPVVRP
jgi:hypothetical protein